LENHFDNIHYNEELRHFNEKELIDFFRECEAVIVSEDLITKKVIDSLPNLQIVSKFGVGLDSIDTEYLKTKNIKLGWKSGINSEAVAQLSLSYLILMLREAYTLNRRLLSNEWAKVSNSRDLSDMSIGIVGYGNVGKKLASYLQIFNLNVLIFDPIIKEGEIIDDKVRSVAFRDILKLSDAISIHVPLTSDTKSLFGKKELLMMKPGSVLINLSRGGVVNESALLTVLEEGHLAGAASDVFEDEPQNTSYFSSRLLDCANFFSTPHIAGTTNQTIKRLGEAAIDSLMENYQE
tara:strand:- start:22 stop:900 length:879 start_codon:yes stop_codon:yes gene_type:complete